MKQRDRDDRRKRLRNDDRSQYAQMTGPVDHGRLVEVSRKGHEELPQQEDEQRVAKKFGKVSGRKLEVKPACGTG